MCAGTGQCSPTVGGKGPEDTGVSPTLCRDLWAEPAHDRPSEVNLSFPPPLPLPL